MERRGVLFVEIRESFFPAPARRVCIVVFPEIKGACPRRNDAVGIDGWFSYKLGRFDGRSSPMEEGHRLGSSEVRQTF